MKKQLTQEQSNRLIALGVPKERASIVETYPVLKDVTQRPVETTVRVFTLTDLIELLPNNQLATTGFRYLNSTYDGRGDRLTDVWCVDYYDEIRFTNNQEYDKELIDAMFRTLVNHLQRNGKSNIQTV